jgi:hypothetical protein
MKMSVVYFKKSQKVKDPSKTNQNKSKIQKEEE